MRKSKKEALKQWLQNERPPQITEAHFAHLLELLEPISEGYLRRILRESGTALSPVVEGVVQDSFENLERTLRALSEEYERSGRTRARTIRNLVILAKKHTRWAALRSPEKAPVKKEMEAWILVWLENPTVFPIWVNLRLLLLERL
jgi:hypothetical protein